ncbi:MAG: hypothetical protein ACJ768_19660 [Gaiellaceae bacterium]
MIQAVRNIIRRWTDSSNSLHPLSALVEEWNKEKVGEVSVNPPNILAGARADVVIALPAGTAAAGDMVLVQPPPTLEAGLVASRFWISAADQLTITIYNPTAGAIDGAALNWTYVILAGKQLSVI